MKDQILAYGYTKPDDGKWIAICVNMCLFAQGDSYVEAMKKMNQAIEDYIDYIRETYPENWEAYLYHPAPDEFIEEFKRVSEEFGSLAHKPKLVSEFPAHKEKGYGFEIPADYAEAGV